MSFPLLAPPPKSASLVNLLQPSKPENYRVLRKKDILPHSPSLSLTPNLGLRVEPELCPRFAADPRLNNTQLSFVAGCRE